jgi:hypothetical protein
MNEYAKIIFIGELESQCRFALNAVGQIEFSLKNLHSQAPGPEKARFSSSEVFRGIHSFLTHASNVSRILWPGTIPKKKLNEDDDQYHKRISKTKRAVLRANELRDELGLPKEHVLKSRKLRNHLEHFDDRIDDWEEHSKNKNFAQDIIGPPNAIVGIAETDRMRWFNPSDGTFHFRGEKFSIQDIVTGIDILFPTLAPKEEELRQKQAVMKEQGKQAQPTSE